MSISDQLQSLAVGVIAGTCAATPLMAAVVPQRGGLTLIMMHFGAAALGGLLYGAARTLSYPGYPGKLRAAAVAAAFAVTAGTMATNAPTEKRLQQQEEEARRNPPYVAIPAMNGQA